MGLDFIRDTAKYFEQKRDKAKLQELDVSDLLSRATPDAFVPLFRCQLTDSEIALAVGLGLTGRVTPELEVKIWKGPRVIGYMLADDAARLLHLMKLNHCFHGGLISLSIEQSASLDGSFVVKVKKRFKYRD